MFAAALWGTRWRRFATCATVALGALGAVGALAQSATTFTATAQTVQASMSVPLPFLGAGLGHAARAGRPWPRAQVGSLGVAVGVAVVAALVGSVLAAVVAGVAGSGWDRWPVVVLTAVAVQVLAQLTGTGFGLLVRPAWVAGLLTVVAPLGAYAALCGTGLQEWLTPYGALLAVFDPGVRPRDWGRWLVVLAVWGLGLNVVGVALLRRRADRG